MNPIWIGVAGTIIAVIMLIAAFRQGQRGKGAGIVMTQALIALLFIGVVWFIILRLLT
ncbi:hypothetical protein HUO12_09545 [Altererythrobacter sp. JGD-16]|uniref:Uncharacterized protein n=1 Tax=Altererythrobacter lutimaris TaxID=2743979 RepID=A0A850HC68_9SPHN|nr:hypothetical protein [Altererythrobacter lutimaris]